MSDDTGTARAAVLTVGSAYDEAELIADVELFRERLRHVVKLLDNTRDPLTAAGYILASAEVIRPLCFRLATATEAASSSLN